MVIPMDTYPMLSNPSIRASNDFIPKGVEIGMACATALSVIGTCIGFILPLGPIVWGLGLSGIGFAIGYVIYYLFNKNTHRHIPKKLPEVTVIVECSENQSSSVVDLMWKYRVLTVGKSTDAN